MSLFVRFIVAVIVEFNKTLLKTFSVTNLDTLANIGSRIIPICFILLYRDKFCFPIPIDECVISEKEMRIPMQNLTHHQLKKLFELRPDLKIEMEEMKRLDPTVEFILVFKYGMY